jgi:hypothetical protein
MKSGLAKTLRAPLHAKVFYSLALFALLFALLCVLGVNVLLAAGLAKGVSWATFAGLLALAAVRR